MMPSAYEQYRRQVALPMRQELTEEGFVELKTADEVDSFMDQVEGTTLVVINSICGCAAGLARPAAITSLKHMNKPDHIVTVFAGQDKEATEKMRSYFPQFAPSSPAYALLNGKECVHFISREEIESNVIEDIIRRLALAYNEHCH